MGFFAAALFLVVVTNLVNRCHQPQRGRLCTQACSTPNNDESGVCCSTETLSIVAGESSVVEKCVTVLILGVQKTISSLHDMTVSAVARVLMFDSQHLPDVSEMVRIVAS